MNLKRTRNFIENEIDKDIVSTENGVNPPAPNPAHNSNFSLLSVLGRERLAEEFEAHRKHYDHANKVSCIMASSMSRELQKTFENTYEMNQQLNQQLKEMFQAKASKERLDVVKSLMACKLKPGALICAFVLEMKGYFDRLESLNMEELHVTWAHLEKKRTRLRTYTNIDQEFSYSGWRR
ncbi:hypothetical protein Tco_0041730, partial [Tanacetum coccineum]